MRRIGLVITVGLDASAETKARLEDLYCDSIEDRGGLGRRMVDFHVLFEAFLRWAWEGSRHIPFLTLVVFVPLLACYLLSSKIPSLLHFWDLGEGIVSNGRSIRQRNTAVTCAGHRPQDYFCNSIFVFRGSSRQTGS